MRAFMGAADPVCIEDDATMPRSMIGAMSRQNMPATISRIPNATSPTLRSLKFGIPVVCKPFAMLHILPKLHARLQCDPSEFERYDQGSEPRHTHLPAVRMTRRNEIIFSLVSSVKQTIPFGESERSLGQTRGKHVPQG